MKNAIQKGNTLPLIAPYARTAGQAMLVGAILGVCANDVAQGVEVEADVVGVFELPKAAGAVTQGQKLYWDDGNKVVTTNANAGANPLIGAATKAAQNGDATVIIRLNGAVA